MQYKSVEFNILILYYTGERRNHPHCMGRCTYIILFPVYTVPIVFMLFYIRVGKYYMRPRRGSRTYIIDVLQSHFTVCSSNVHKWHVIHFTLCGPHLHKVVPCKAIIYRLYIMYTVYLF